MKYQVLARKYRPKTFATMMGQEHVLKALSNALQSGRLHHAYLFTGTRGVGKTTVARVLAKALNCEQGVSASPCGECAACQEIDQGRFVDLIEVDAASRTKVEDTRELLDNVQYAPTRGRFKIYLIDEVHMLSGHSFNALLKTLEEPPPHVKFLLATTDPQKLPVTILSRCLQFNLKSLTIEQIEQQLHLILNAEKIPFADNVLKPLAIAADGSMRDALSLLDQSIAYSDGKPNLADIEAMLGSVQKDRIFELLAALANEDGRNLIEQNRILTAQGIDVNTILAELISTLQRIALCQMVPDAIDDSRGDKLAVEQIAQHISPEDIQLFYQIALNGRKDLPYSPQPQGGFEMILLRMLAFKPVAGDGRRQAAPTSAQSEVTEVQEKVQEKVQTVTHDKAQNETNSQQNNELAEKKTAETSSEPAISELSNNQVDGVINLQKSNSIPTDPSGNNLNEIDHDLPPVDAYGQENFTESSNVPSFDTEVPLIGELSNNQHSESRYATAKTVLVEEPSAGHKEPSAENKESSTGDKESSTGDKESSTGDKESSTAHIINKKPIVKNEKPLADVVPLFKSDFQDNIPCNEQQSKELADYWHDLINSSELNGLEQQLAKHCALVKKSVLESKTQQNNDQYFELSLDSVHKHLLSDKITSRLINTLQELLGCNVKVVIKECQVLAEEQLNTPRRREIHDAEVLQQQAVESVYSDPKVQMIVNAFAAKILKKSIKPV